MVVALYRKRCLAKIAWFFIFRKKLQKSFEDSCGMFVLDHFAGEKLNNF